MGTIAPLWPKMPGHRIGDAVARHGRSRRCLGCSLENLVQGVHATKGPTACRAYSEIAVMPADRVFHGYDRDSSPCPMSNQHSRKAAGPSRNEMALVRTLPPITGRRA